MISTNRNPGVVSCIVEPEPCTMRNKRSSTTPNTFMSTSVCRLFFFKARHAHHQHIISNENNSKSCRCRSEFILTKSLAVDGTGNGKSGRIFNSPSRLVPPCSLSSRAERTSGHLSTTLHQDQPRYPATSPLTHVGILNIDTHGEGRWFVRTKRDRSSPGRGPV